MELPESHLTNSAPIIESKHQNDHDDDVVHSSSKLLLGGIDMISSPFTYKKREKELQMKQRRMRLMMVGKERRDSRNRTDSNSKAYVPDEDDFQLFDVTSLPSATIIRPTPPVRISAKKWYDDHCDENVDSYTTAATAPTTATACHSSSCPPLPPSTCHILSMTSSSSSSTSSSYPSPSNYYRGSELLPQLDRKKCYGGRNELLFQSTNKDVLTHMTIQIPTSPHKPSTSAGIKKVKKKKKNKKKKSEIPNGATTIV